MEGKAERVDRTGAVTGGGANCVRQRRGEEDGAQVGVRAEVGVGAAGEFRAGKRGEKSDDVARVRISGCRAARRVRKARCPSGEVVKAM